MEDGLHWGVIFWPILVASVIGIMAWLIRGAMEPDKHFPKRHYCRNCGKFFTRYYPRGTDVDASSWYSRTRIHEPDRVSYQVICPRCDSKKVV